MQLSIQIRENLRFQQGYTEKPEPDRLIEQNYFVMGRIFSLSTVVLLTLVETVENPFLACNDAEVACGH